MSHLRARLPLSRWPEEKNGCNDPADLIGNIFSDLENVADLLMMLNDRLDERGLMSREQSLISAIARTLLPTEASVNVLSHWCYARHASERREENAVSAEAQVLLRKLSESLHQVPDDSRRRLRQMTGSLMDWIAGAKLRRSEGSEFDAGEYIEHCSRIAIGMNEVHEALGGIPAALEEALSELLQARGAPTPHDIAHHPS